MNDTPTHHGFEHSQAELAALTELLGGSMFARICIAHGMATAVRELVDLRFNRKHGPACSAVIYPAEPLLALPDDWDDAARLIRRRVAGAHGPLIARSEPRGEGVLALRTDDADAPRQAGLWFGTDRAELLLAACRKMSGPEGPRSWSVTIEADGHRFFRIIGGRSPTAHAAYAASLDGGIRSLRRLAKDAFQMPLVHEGDERAAA